MSSSMLSSARMLRHAAASSSSAVAASSGSSVSNAGGSLAPSAAAALRALRMAGFDTPAAPAAANTALASSSASPSSLAASPCPLSGAAISSPLPSVFVASGFCPCGQFAASATPTSCAWGASMRAAASAVAASASVNNKLAAQGVEQALQVARTMQRRSVNGRMHARAFSTTAQANDASATSTAASPSTSTSSSAADATPAAATAVASTAPVDVAAAEPTEPPQPPAVALSPASSAAHSGLLAIEEYRTGIQQLSRGGAASSSGGSSSSPQPALARASLRRVLDIVAYIPHQPFFALHVKNLLAYSLMKSGLYCEERTLRGEVLREVDKMWMAGVGKSSVRDADALLLHRAINSYALVCLRMRAYAEVKTLCDTWMARFETLLFGKGSSVSASSAAPSAAASSRFGSSLQSQFSTGATQTKLLAEHLTLMQLLLVSQTAVATSSSAAGDTLAESKRQEIRASLQRAVSSLASSMASKPYLQASGEWKLFQGEMLLMPVAVHEFVDCKALLPPREQSSAGTTPDATAAAPAVKVSSASDSAAASPASAPPSLAVDLSERAVAYFQAHPELQRLPLSETTLRRVWYSPLVHSLLSCATAHAQGPATASAPSSQRALSLLSTALSYVERSVSSDASNPLLLRTLLQLGVLSHARLGEAIQAEGLFRAVVGRLESTLTVGSSGVQPSVDAQRFGAYVDALAEYIYLLKHLEWNKASRMPEARALYHSKLVRLAQQGGEISTLLMRASQEARRDVGLPVERAAIADIASPQDIPDSWLALSLRASAAVVPEWLTDKLQVGSGVVSEAGR